MQTFEIVSIGENDGPCLLKGELGAAAEVHLPSLSAAALHAQFCAEGNAAILRIVNPDGTLRTERAIPAWSDDEHFATKVGRSWGWF